MDTEKTSVAALISVILRRKANRIIDVKWLIQNQEYAREIINLSREQGQHDLNEYADHLERLMFGTNTASPAAQKVKTFEEPKPPISSWTEVSDDGDQDDDTPGEVDTSQYVGHLR